MAQIPTQEMEMVKNLRGVDQKEYYVPGHRTCAGCGPALCYKLVVEFLACLHRDAVTVTKFS